MAKTTTRLKIFIFTLIAIAVAAFFYWQYNKKGIVRNVIESSVAKSSDSLYVISYDSSAIDEINGNATFYNLRLQSDTLMKQLYLLDDTTGLPQTLFNIVIGKVNIVGADIPALMSNQRITAKIIEILNPRVLITSTGTTSAEKPVSIDTMALYERITGKFSNISADTIKVLDGYISLANGNNPAHTHLKDVDFQISGLRIDSTRNYNNIISYFVKDAIAKVQEVEIGSGDKDMLLEGVEYNAVNKFISVSKITQKDKAGKTLINLENSRVVGLSTNDFVYANAIKADSVVTDGGQLSFYTSNDNTGQNRSLNIDNNFFDRAVIKNVKLKNTTVSILDKDNPNAEPFVLKGAAFTASDLGTVSSSTNLGRFIGHNNWTFSANGFSINSKDNTYRLTAGPFILDNEKKTITLSTFRYQPQISVQEFVKRQKYQTDYFDISASNTVFTGADIQAFINKKQIIAQSGRISPKITVFNDRTLPPNPKSKVGQYPHQILKNLNMPVYVASMKVENGHVLYRERSAITKQTADIFFSRINGTITNATNIPSYIAQNPNMVLDATARFLDKAPLSTKWTLPMNTSNGSFSLSAVISNMKATDLNPVIEPLGPAQARQGKINKLTFSVTGNDLESKGSYSINYDDVKVNVLKSSGDSTAELEKKGLLSTLANFVLKNDINTTVEITEPREKNRSFFNLIWKGLFSAVKKGGMKINIGK